MSEKSLTVADSAELPSVAIVIVSWNSWSDVLECLESVFRLDYPNFKVILSDNGSTDGTADRLHSWAEGDLCVLPTDRKMAGFSQPTINKPMALNVVDALEVADVADGFEPWDITLIRNGENLGFAAGNNVGFRYSLAQGFDYVWVLNADTVVTPSSLGELVVRMQSDPDAGLCGSLLCYYDAPDVIQEAGGCAFFPWVGLARRLAGDRRRDEVGNWRELEQRLGYVSAASCLVSREFLTDVGLMCEDYFLYCEEIDWATRGRDAFKMALAERSVVFHKKGRTTGSKSVSSARSPASAYFLWRARRRFMERYYKWGVPGLFSAGLFSALVDLTRRNRATAASTLRGVLDRPNDRA